MSEGQIVVRLNPDCPPTGSCLGIVNAARKSFGRRSEWDYYKSNGDLLSETEVACFDREDKDCHFTKKLKDKDKRLLEFLARGMTAADFDEFVENTKCQGYFAMDAEYDRDGRVTESLIERLWQWRNTPTHDTPFNHGFFSFEIKAPIFVARHLVKHEYLIMSEYSRRYITDDVEFYKHTYRTKAEDVKQGSGGVHEDNKHYQNLVAMANTQSILRYEAMIADGLAPEQARGHLPVDLMTAWTWSGSFGAFANMCQLRLSKDTQYETRLVAQSVYEELKKQFPVAAPLLVHGVL